MAITNYISPLRKEPYPHNILTILLKTSPFDLNVSMEQLRVYEEGLRKAIATLPEREQKVLCWRYMEHKTLVEIGSLLGVGTERIRQIEMHALRNLREKKRLLKRKPLKIVRI